MVGPASLLFIPNPLRHFLQAWLFAVHQNADAVDFTAEPDEEDGGGVEHAEGEHFLPQGHTKGDAHHHDDGRGEGEDGSPEGERTVGVFGAVHGGVEAEYLSLIHISEPTRRTD